MLAVGYALARRRSMRAHCCAALIAASIAGEFRVSTARTSVCACSARQTAVSQPIDAGSTKIDAQPDSNTAPSKMDFFMVTAPVIGRIAVGRCYRNQRISQDYGLWLTGGRPQYIVLASTF